MLATERFIVEVDDITREQVSIVFDIRKNINIAAMIFGILFSGIFLSLKYVTDVLLSAHLNNTT